MRTRTLLACGVVAGPLFVATFLVEGATRAGYDPLRHPVSSLQFGDLGWMQVANFVVAGVLTVAFGVGLWRVLRPMGSVWGSLLVGAHGVGLMGSGVFITDPVSGYPPGTPDRLDSWGSVHAALHDLFAVPTFLGLPVACFVLAWRFGRWGHRGWASYLVVSGVASAAGFVLTGMALNQVEALVAFGGLLQRVTITISWTWLTLLAVHLLRAGADRDVERTGGVGGAA